METKTMAIVGTGLVCAGIGLSAIGAVLIMPAAIVLAASVVEKASGPVGDTIKRASKQAGAVAGTLQRSFSEAARAGMTEIRRESSSVGKQA
jgi:hypothetical protein